MKNKILKSIKKSLTCILYHTNNNEKWDYHNFTKEQLSRRISDIRREYNINVYIPK